MSKEKVFTALARRPGEYLSGEALSQEIGITRAAVWKAVEALRQDGYTILAKTGSGYALTAAPDALTEREIRRFLPPGNYPLRCLEEVDSTNSYLKRIALENAPHGTAAIANFQTGGKGRLGRTFQSPRGKGVYLSILLRPDWTGEETLPVTALTAVAVCNAVEQVCGTRPQIKWTDRKSVV